MTDKRKHSRSRRTEDLSPAELREQIEEDKKKAGRSTVFLLAALVAIIVICIAWFVANTRVHVTTGTIGAQDSTLFELASVGARQTAESEYLKDADGKNLLTEGQSKEYSVYYDMEQGKEVSAQQIYHVGTADLAWYLKSADTEVSPGVSGKLEFYIIPKVNNLRSVTVKMSTEAYHNTGNDKAEKMNNPTLQNLIQGHILLFQSFDNEKGYSNWIQSAEGFTIQAPKSDTAPAQNTFVKDMPYKITVYWIWPKYFRNYIYNQKSSQEDLFGEAADKTTQKKLLDYVKTQAENANKNSSTLFYSKDNSTINISVDDINPATMQDSVLTACSQYYNEADEYIGTNAEYLYVRAEVSGSV